VAHAVVRQDHYFITQIVTGPQHLRLWLDLQPERIADPFVTAAAVCSLYGQPQDEVVRAAVLRGTDEANAECGTCRHPLEIRYYYSGYDNRKCMLMTRAAYIIIKELAERGEDRIEAAPSPLTSGPAESA
jgi:hypothetical protein